MDRSANERPMDTHVVLPPIQEVPFHEVRQADEDEEEQAVADLQVKEVPDAHKDLCDTGAHVPLDVLDLLPPEPIRLGSRVGRGRAAAALTLVFRVPVLPCRHPGSRFLVKDALGFVLAPQLVDPAAEGVAQLLGLVDFGGRRDILE